MGLHGGLADEEAGGDVGVGLAGGDALEHLNRGY